MWVSAGIDHGTDSQIQ